MVSGARSEFESNSTQNIMLADQMWLQVLQDQGTNDCYSTALFMSDC